MIREIIVVEGKDDTAAVRRAVSADTIETGGSALNEQTLKRIALAQQRRGVIILTDPDHAGERLRKLISARVPGCKHAFIRKSDAMHKEDVGVENASVETIRHALQHVKIDCSAQLQAQQTEVTWDDMLDAGLIHHPQAAERRRWVGDFLGIGYANGKQFHKRCAMFRIRLDEFRQAINNLESLKEEEDGSATHTGHRFT